MMFSILKIGTSLSEEVQSLNLPLIKLNESVFKWEKHLDFQWNFCYAGDHLVLHFHTRQLNQESTAHKRLPNFGPVHRFSIINCTNRPLSKKKKNKKTKDKKSNLIKTRRKGVFSVELRLWLRNHRESIGATMRRLPMTTSFSFTLLLTTTFWTLSYGFVRPPTLLQLQSLSGSSNYLTKEELWFDQTLDHFSPYDHRRFPQRYYEFLDYFRPSDGPIFLKICGESACPGIANDYLSVSFDFWFLQKGYKLEKNRNFL